MRCLPDTDQTFCYFCKLASSHLLQLHFMQGANMRNKNKTEHIDCQWIGVSNTNHIIWIVWICPQRSVKLGKIQPINHWRFSLLCCGAFMCVEGRTQKNWAVHPVRCCTDQRRLKLISTGTDSGLASSDTSDTKKASQRNSNWSVKSFFYNESKQYIYIFFLWVMAEINLGS